MLEPDGYQEVDVELQYWIHCLPEAQEASLAVAAASQDKFRILAGTQHLGIRPCHRTGMLKFTTSNHDHSAHQPTGIGCLLSPIFGARSLVACR
jgi:hypothetical protein